jgi:2-polyprenyl-3-methyl-5-hydroxy-6-metoxy-1,4-benzoquinol methylase
LITAWSHGSADGHMDESILVELSPLIAQHPWWIARARLTLALLDRLAIRPPSTVLDAGCGWGVTLGALERRGYRATGLDVSRRALDHLDRDGRALVEADLTRPWPVGSPRFDAVLALDVIEHLDDDIAAVARLAERVTPGGVAIVSVPALPELFSEFDAIQGHRRRYQPETLRAAFATSGLVVDHLFWWGGWLARRLAKSRSRPRSRPGESPSRTYRRYLDLPPWPATWLIRAMFAAEQKAALDGRLNTGTSLFAVARRPL